MTRPTSFGRGAAVLLVALVLSLLVSSAAFAQTGTSSVRGTVTDAQGNVVPGAAVTLVDPQTNQTRTQVSGDDGHFVFDLIPPGTYRVEVEAKGFKKVVQTNVQALVAKATDIAVALEVGNVTETVTVTAGGAEALVNTQDATLGNNFVSQQITQLPLEARNVNQLLTLQPGATREGYVAGARADQANVTLDGVDINEAQTNQIGGAAGGGSGSNNLIDSTASPDRNTVFRLNADAIQEFRVTTANPNASQGRSSGAQVEIISKGGGNEMHGSLYEAHRNTIFTANNFFNNRNGRFTATDQEVLLGRAQVGDLRNPRPKLIRNTFGGSVDGPIVKDKLFFFYAYEGRRDASEQTVVQVVPLASLGRGEVRYLNPSGGVTTVTSANLATIFPELGGTNPAALQTLAAAAARYPANDFTVGDSQPGRLLNTAGFRFNSSTPVKLNQHWAKFDWNVTKAQQLSVRPIVQYDLFGGASAFPDTPTADTWSHPWGFVAQHTWTINDHLVNNFRYGLSREAFTTQGDSTDNAVFFRFVFSPRNFSRTVSRETPTQTFADDFTWSKESHSFQFGGNVRIIRNRRTSFGNSFDTALTNPSFYAQSGTPLSAAINSFAPIGSGFSSSVQNAAAAVLGRFTQYSARFVFDRSGQLAPSGTPTERNFATEEYDGYVQDTWRMRHNLTMTYGLRYSLSRPVYEANGFEVKPNIPLAEYFQRRLDAAAKGQNYNEPLLFDLSGPKNGRSSLYSWDKNNFQPRIGIAWSPDFHSGILGTIFGAGGQSVVRGGFGILNDYYGQQLAVSFDLNNTLGFLSNTTIAAGTFNTNTRPGPLFTGLGQAVRPLPGITVPSQLTFPLNQPQDNARRIETSFDENLTAPTHYNWSMTFERKLPKGLALQASYIGRAGRHMLATRDVMMPNNLTDPKSGMDWYTAAGILEDFRRNGTPISQIPAIPYFENLFAGVPNLARGLLGASRAGLAANATQAVYGDAFIFNGNDWTTTQSDIDDVANARGFANFFYNSQYGALSSFGSVGNLNYNAGTISIRERLGERLLLDFNYTLSHTLDDASGLQTSGGFGTAFILNPIRQHDAYANSDYDVRHLININGVWQLPMGRGQWLLHDANKVVNGILGGWQLSGIFRWNSGLPIFSPYDAATWATNWNAQSSGVRVSSVETCATRGGAAAPKLFCDPAGAYHSFRNAKPGETGDRNVLRLPGYVNLDLGLAKSFSMPWSERHKLQIRWETFNVTNTQRLGTIDSSRTGFGLVVDPQTATPPTNWSNFTAIQGSPRVMQFGFRYDF
jgi:Carboxypeptidase regulatory-like domain